MAEVVATLADRRRARIVFTEARHGDLGIDAPPGERDARRHAVVPGPWTALRQVHGAEVVRVEAAGQHHGAAADAAVTASSASPIAVQTADCAPIALLAEGGAVGVVHAGWRGLVSGVVERAVAALTELAGPPVRAVLGPCIHPECYEFADPELAAMVRRFGEGVRATTAAGTPALDLPNAVRLALEEVEVPLDTSHCTCTACGGRWFSHRARGETARQVLVAWIEDP